MLTRSHGIDSSIGAAKLVRAGKRACALGASALMLSAAAQADFNADNYITGDWGGERAKLAEQGVNIKLGYFSEAAHNVKGGGSHETAYADQFFLGGYFDLEKLMGWQGAEFKIEVTNRNGDLINNEADMPFLLQSQQIFGRGNVTRLTQFSLTQKLFDDHLSIKAGRIYPSADFFAMSCAFQHLTFCSGGSSNYISSSWYGDPLSALGAQVTYTPDNHWFFKVGSYDANTQNLSRNQGLKLDTSGGEPGTLIVGEVEYKATYENGLDGDYRFGVTRSSQNKTNTVNALGFPTSTSSLIGAEVEDDDRAFYVNLEQQITRNDNGGGLRMFASMINPDDQVSSIGSVIAVGGFIEAPFASRPYDRVGLAIGRNSVSSRLTSAQKAFNAAGGNIDVQEHEYPVELNYNYVLTPAIQIMPSIQYVKNPNGVKKNDDAVVLGMQFSLNF